MTAYVWVVKTGIIVELDICVFIVPFFLQIKPPPVRYLKMTPHKHTCYFACKENENERDEVIIDSGSRGRASKRCLQVSGLSRPTKRLFFLITESVVRSLGILQRSEMAAVLSLFYYYYYYPHELSPCW